MKFLYIDSDKGKQKKFEVDISSIQVTPVELKVLTNKTLQAEPAYFHYLWQSCDWRIVDENGKNHTFKKYRVIKISDDTENYKKPEQIKKAVKENKIIRLIKKEDLIDEPKESRTRREPKQKNYDDYIL
jgi:Zn-dependent metalloprotease